MSSPDPRAPGLLVVGVGNALLGDEGFGVHVASDLLAVRVRWPPGLEVIEAGTALLDVAPLLAGRERVVLVDAVRLGGVPGTRYRIEITPSAVREALAAVPHSLHEWGVLDTLVALAYLGQAPRSVTVLGAEPERIAPSLVLSPVLARAAAETVEDLLRGRLDDRAQSC